MGRMYEPKRGQGKDADSLDTAWDIFRLLPEMRILFYWQDKCSTLAMHCALKALHTLTTVRYPELPADFFGFTIANIGVYCYYYVSNKPARSHKCHHSYPFPPRVTPVPEEAEPC